MTNIRKKERLQIRKERSRKEDRKRRQTSKKERCN